MAQITCSLKVVFQVADVDFLLSVYAVLPIPLLTENGPLFVIVPMKSYLLVYGVSKSAYCGRYKGALSAERYR